MSACRYCGADVERMDRHYAAEPDAGGCKIVALALGDWWPNTDEREARAAPLVVARDPHKPLPVRDGKRWCRCGRGPVMSDQAWRCLDCNREYNRTRRAARPLAKLAARP